MLHTMHRGRRRLALLFIAAAFTIGCDKQTVEPAPRGEAESNAEPPAATVEVALHDASPEQYAEEIATLKGKVVLVDFWATWCPPCMEQFPHTLELAAKYPESELQVLTVSADMPKDRERVLRFLQKKQATASKNFLTTLDLSATFEQFDVRGGIPFYKMYDREGKLRYEFNGAPAPDDNTEPIENIEVRLKELLDERPPQ